MCKIRLFSKTYSFLPAILLLLWCKMDTELSVYSSIKPTSLSHNRVVMDTIPPVAVCLNQLVVNLMSNGNRTVAATAFDDGSYDEFGPIWFKARRLMPGACGSDTMYRSQLNFCCEDVGDTLFVALRVYDKPVDTSAVTPSYLFDNSSDCVVRVLVKDVTKPVIATFSAVTLGCNEYLAQMPELPIASDECCLDTVIFTDQYFNFDTLCKRGVVRRRFTAFDCSGNTATSTQLLTVEHEQDYFVRFPNDTIVVGCNNLVNLGMPTIYGGNCEAINRTYNDVTIADNSGLGSCRLIQRQWTVFNWCTYNPGLPFIEVPNPNPSANVGAPQNRPGPVVAPEGSIPPPTVVFVKPTDTIPTNFSQFWVNNANGFRYTQWIRVIDTVAPEARVTSPSFFCDLTANDALLWAGGNWLEASTNVNDLRELATELSIVAGDGCAKSTLNIRYELYLDLNQDDVFETLVRSDAPPASGTINFNNIPTGVGEQRTFDNRIIGINQKHRFGLQVAMYGDTLIAKARWNTLGTPNTFVAMQLPYGRHKIKWFVNDQCGNQRILNHPFAVSNDCEAPTMTCLGEYDADLPAVGDSVRVYAADLVQNILDNTTPPTEIQLAVQPLPFSETFPKDANGNPIAFWEATCADAGIQRVRVWARDLFGNATTCDVTIVVDDPEEQCTTFNPFIRGWVYTPAKTPIDDVKFMLYNLPDTLPSDTSDNLEFRYYFFNSLTAFDNYAVVARRDSSSWLNGVTTLDLVQISRHILGSEPFVSPYQYIAADANRSGTVNTFDIVAFRKLILGITEDVLGNTSWRFIPSSFVFTNPSNPFASTIPDRFVLPALHTKRDSCDFIGVKIGDVNNSANPSFFTGGADDRGQMPLGLQLTIGESQLIEGVQKVPIYASAITDLVGFQFECTFEQWGKGITGFEPATDWAQYYYWRTEQHSLRVSCDQALLQSEGAVLLGYLTLDKSVGSVPIVASLSAPIYFTSEAYTTVGESSRIELTTLTTSSNLEGVQVEITPNPAHTTATIRYYLPIEDEVTIQILDMQGRVVRQWSGATSKGAHQFVFDTKEQPSGIYLCSVATSTERVVCKLVVQ